MNKIVVVLSGGMDSTVLLYQLYNEGHTVSAISFNYGQRHKRELEYAAQTCQRLGIKHEIVDMSGLAKILPGSSQTDPTVPVPSGHYAEESMKKTVVPNRNMIMLSIAIAYTITHECETVAFAVHAGDHAVYPDCRGEFVEAMNAAAELCDWKEVEIVAPFINDSKANIVRIGAVENVPFDETYSCYAGKETHCGRCGTCIERREAFFLAGVEDPTTYDDSAPSLAYLIDNDWKLKG